MNDFSRRDRSVLDLPAIGHGMTRASDSSTINWNRRDDEPAENLFPLINGVGQQDRPGRCRQCAAPVDLETFVPEKKQRDLPVIGWREWIGLPEFGLRAIKAKVDTGARSSSLHAFDLKQFKASGEEWVRFKIHPIQRKKTREIEVTAPVLDFRSVRSSNGKESVRPVIKTLIEVCGQTIAVELTLANRDQMGFRMLLGREAFRHRFLVDAGESYFGGRPKRKKRRRKKSDEDAD